MGACRLMIQSVGSATPAISLALAHALPFSREHLARCVYQAPAVLLDGIERKDADTLCEILARSGLEVSVDDIESPFTVGGPEYEVAIHVEVNAGFRDIAAELARFIGSTPARAVELLCASPAIVLGQVSWSTVQALRARMEKLGAQLDVSKVAEAHYDVFIDAQQEPLRHRLQRELSKRGVDCIKEGPLLASGINREVANALWQRSGSQKGWCLLDQAFQRFDIWLEEPAQSEQAIAAIINCTGMPAELISRVNAALPFLLLESVASTEASAILASLNESGVRAVAQLITLVKWDLNVQSVQDPRAAIQIIHRIAGKDDATLLHSLSRPPAKISVGFTLARARWLVAELAAVGCRTELVSR